MTRSFTIKEAKKLLESHKELQTKIQNSIFLIHLLINQLQLKEQWK